MNMQASKHLYNHKINMEKDNIIFRWFFFLYVVVKIIFRIDGNVGIIYGRKMILNISIFDFFLTREYFLLEREAPHILYTNEYT